MTTLQDVTLEKLCRLLKEARQYVADAASNDEDPETNRNAQSLLNEIDWTLS